MHRKEIEYRRALSLSKILDKPLEGEYGRISDSIDVICDSISKIMSINSTQYSFLIKPFDNRESIFCKERRNNILEIRGTIIEQLFADVYKTKHTSFEDYDNFRFIGSFLSTELSRRLNLDVIII